MQSLRVTACNVIAIPGAPMLVLGLAYTAFACLGLNWAQVMGAGSPVWPASGVALAGLLLGGLRLWPAIFFGRLAAGWLSGSEQPFWAELLLAIANTLAATIPLLLTRSRGLLKPALDDLQALLNYLFWGALVGGLIAGVLGTLTLAASSALPVTQLPPILTNWVVAYFVGAVLLGPFLLSWLPFSSPFTWFERAHLAAVLLVTLVFSSLFLLPPNQAFLRTWHIFPVLVWAALAFDLRGATIAMIIVASAATWAADHGLGPMNPYAAITAQKVSLAQQFVAITAATTLALAVVASERRAKNALAEQGRLLRIAEEEARARAEELEVLLAAVPAAIWVARDPDCNEIVGNATSARLLRLPAASGNMSKSRDDNAAVSHYTVLDRDGRELSPEDLPVQRAARGEVVWDFEERILFNDGTALDLLGNATPLYSKAGEIRGAVAAFIDITERKAAESREHLLAREVDHRAKNIMAVIQAIVHLTDAEDIAGFRKAISGRIASLARSHTLLAENRWDGAELRELIEEELAPYIPRRSNAAHRVTLSGPQVKLKPLTAQSITLILHELITNALKHGSLSNDVGQLAIDWQVDAPGPDQRLALRWVETGGPTIHSQGKSNFGLSLIEITARDQLYGSIESLWKPSGLTVEMSVPVGELLRPNSATT
ncbi:MAG: hypothetical protein RL519_1813 [Pseudomonadota bacterium]